MMPLTFCSILATLALPVVPQVLQPQLGLRQLGILLGHTGLQSINLLIGCLQRLLNLPVGLLNVAGRHLCNAHKVMNVL